MLIPSSSVRASLFMLTAVATSGLNNCITRLATDQGIHAFEAAMFRNVFGFISVALIVLWTEGTVPRTHRLGKIAASCILHVGSMLAFMVGLATLPLNESGALGFAGPLFVTIGAALFLGEKVRIRRWSAVAAGFVGVLIIIRPGVIPFSVGAALVLLSTMLGASVTLLYKGFSASERPQTLIFYQCLISSFLSVPLAAFVWTTPSPFAFFMLALTGALGTLSWLAFLRACRLVDASAIMPLEFAKLPIIALVAYLMFGEMPDQLVWLGAAVIFGSNLYIAHREALAARRAAAGSGR